ncbi:MAG: hypothetical protein AB8G22_28850, partial [Saprospiraceae bacterium]
YNSMYQSSIFDRPVIAPLIVVIVICVSLPLFVWFGYSFFYPNEDASEIFKFLIIGTFLTVIVTLLYKEEYYSFTLDQNRLVVKYIYWRENRVIAIKGINSATFTPIFGRFPSHEIILQLSDTQIIKLHTPYHETIISTLQILQQQSIPIYWKERKIVLSVHRPKTEEVRQFLLAEKIIFS